MGLFQTTPASLNLHVDLAHLQNDRLKLVPLEENLEEWAATWVKDANLNPSIYTWLTYGPFADGAEYVAWYDNHIRHNASTILFAILLRPGTVARKDPITGEMRSFDVSEGTFAGISGLVGQPEHATVDIGQILISRFQRTFVGTATLALLLHECLDSVADGGLGLRRVQWQANAGNTASVNAAKRLGFRLEGVIRWHQVLPVGKVGSVRVNTDSQGTSEETNIGSKSGPGRHTAMLALCWDDWVEGAREHVDALVNR